ncbi:MAG: polysulfide reductase NrfD [Polyangiaceae bacterium]|nr:polysulfide reductase NrfD [Polyangiaceae bacterium]MCE7894338.1 polysulfide reductase [Sorangiineae bacterium PRO1]MCL4754247.1 polysulfide reductase NrfD [Myxococcales bacterium]
MGQFVKYWIRMARCAVVGSRAYYVWMGTLLLFIVMAGLEFNHTLRAGLIVTNMSDDVSWGIGIANFVYFVGVAAGAAVLVVPAYLYHREDIKELVLLGELLAVVAVSMCLLFIMTDVGRPDRLWHLTPGIGHLNLPSSLLSWDVVVFTGYLLMNLHIPGYLLYSRYRGKKPTALMYLPFVFLSMIWAISIHTVTAFLLSGLGSRPFWNTPILAPRFLISAGASAPALLIMLFTVIKHFTKLNVKQSVFDYFLYVLRIAMPINLFLVGCEIFQEFYTGSLHSASAYYLYFGLHGHAMLPAFIWTAVAFNVCATIVFLVPKLRQNTKLMYAACGLTVVGIWTEKGMGLIFPGFVPNPLGEIVEYAPNAGEIILNLGIVALGAFLYTAMAKVTIAIQSGDLRAEGAKALDAEPAPEAEPSGAE